MSKLYAFNKPFKVLSQFSSEGGKQALADYISIPDIYCAGRLDYDSEGLLLLTDDGRLQHTLSHPKFGTTKVYWAQVEGIIDDQALSQLVDGVQLKDGPAKALSASAIEEPQLWARQPPIRFRKDKPTSWVEISLGEGRNRQVRRMTASVGLPTLRLIRHSIGDTQLGDLQPGELRRLDNTL